MPDRRRFFADPVRDGGVPAVAAPYNQPRSLQASSAVLDINSKTSPLKNTLAWQTSAWDYVDQIGELKYAFSLISQVVSRALIFAAVNQDSSEIPIEATVFVDALESEGTNPESFKLAVKIANEIMEELDSKSELLRLAAQNFSISGECYLLNVNGWDIASISELKPGSPPKYNRYRDSSHTIDLPKGTYVARLWRSHPRYSGEADSTMLGVLDQCEKIILFDKVLRAIARSALGAGIVFIPNGLVPASGRSLEEAITDVTTSPVETEAAEGTVRPLILTGSDVLVEKLKRIELARTIDPEMVKAAETAMDRILSGVDIPKNIVSGLEETRYSNALVLDDALFKAHIEPLIILICDALTTAYLRPRMIKAGVSVDVAKKFVVWYNPSHIVTRPDKSQSANEGFDKYLLSGDAWRTARGYTKGDAPEPEEVLLRMVLDKGQIPQEIVQALIERIDPEFFANQRKLNQSTAGVPDEVSALLEGNGTGGANTEGDQPAVNNLPAEPTDSFQQAAQDNGGSPPQGGTMPPRRQT